MGGIYEVCLLDWFSCHDKHTKFHKDCFRHSKVDRRDTQTHRKDGDHTSLLGIEAKTVALLVT
jgi:hypothetical protein